MKRRRKILSETELAVIGRVRPRQAVDRLIEVRQALAGPFPAAKDAAAMERAVRATFAKLGDTHLSLESLAFHNPTHRFVPVSRLNQLRRQLSADLEGALTHALADRTARVQAEVCRFPTGSPKAGTFQWSVKVDRISYVDEFETEDWSAVDELIVDIARDHPAQLIQKLEQAAMVVGKERIRLALPALTRKWEEHGLRLKLEKLLAAGWNKWEAANLSAWSYLGLDPMSGEGSMDLATDWSVYVLNRTAARQLVDMGVRRFVLSPEDGLANMRSLLAEFGPQAVVIVYQDTPLFVAESCAYANLIGGCPGKANCRFESMEMVSSHGERVTALDYHCRTIVLNQGPFCLSTHLTDLAAAGAVSLRADFVYRSYEPKQVRRIWRALRAGRRLPGGHAANLHRGVL